MNRVFFVISLVSVYTLFANAEYWYIDPLLPVLFTPHSIGKCVIKPMCECSMRHVFMWYHVYEYECLMQMYGKAIISLNDSAIIITVITIVITVDCGQS